MKHLVGAVAAVCVVAVAILLLSWNTYFAQLNYAAYDFTLRLAGRIEPSSPTVIVAIDEDSLARDAWPWSRDNLARVVERIEGGRPLAIAVDLILDDPTTGGADEALAAAISHSRNIILGAYIDPVEGNRWRKPNPLFAQNHVRIGHVHADPDFGNITRRILFAKVAGGVLVPALAVETLHGAGVPISGDFEKSVAGASVFRPEPVNIRYIGDNQSFPHIPAWQVLDGRIEAERFKDKIVLIGSTAEGVGDQWFTPFAEQGQRMSGVEIHANAIETLYANRAITETSDLTLLLSLLLFIGGLTWMDRRFEGKRFYAAAVSAGPAAAVASWLLMKYFNVWFPFPPFWASIALAVPTLEVWKIIRVNRDLDGKIERLSKHMGSRNVSAPESAGERLIAGLPDGADRDKLIAILDTYEKESAVVAEQRRKLLGGERHHSQWKLEAVDFFNGELVRFLSFNNAILASIEDVIVVSDPAGRVVYQNPAAGRLEGFREHPPFAPDYFASILDHAGFLDHFAGVLARQETVSMKSVPARNGRDFFNVTMSPISRTGVVFSMHNATAQHELNQAKNDMVSLVSHELRTPLTSIRGYSDMLMKYNLVQEKGRQFLGTIIEESGRLNQLIQSFLDIAYIESGRQKITKTDFEIEPVIKDLLGIIGPIAAEKQIALEPPPVLDPSRAHADRLLLYQALTNLVTNAVKYSPSGTTVKMAISNGDGRIRFQVSDQGFGIPAGETSKVFEKFYRRGNRETREQSGFGLGLAFVKEVATRHGGDVVVESEVGKGSVFTLWIPN